VSLQLIKINIQIRTIKPVSAIGTTDLAVLFVHFTSAFVASPNPLLAPLNRLEKNRVESTDVFWAQVLYLLHGDFNISSKFSHLNSTADIRPVF